MAAEASQVGLETEQESSAEYTHPLPRAAYVLHAPCRECRQMP